MPPPLAKASGSAPAAGQPLDGWRDVYLVTRLFDTNLHRVIYSGHALSDAHIQYIVWQVFAPSATCTARASCTAT